MRVLEKKFFSLPITNYMHVYTYVNIYNYHFIDYFILSPLYPFNYTFMFQLSMSYV